MRPRIGCMVIGFLSLVLSLAGQTASSGSTFSLVPPLIQFSDVAIDEGGYTLNGVVSITFSLYNGQHGGERLWTETQNNIQLDAVGDYSVQLGVTKPNGVPSILFASGEARWLGVRIAEQAELPRVLLVSVPYALKAGDAATVGGLPASAFVLASPANSAAVGLTTEYSTVPPPAGTVTGTGTLNYLPLWDSTSNIISSTLFQSGSGTTAKIGINTSTPVSTLDIKGGSTVRGTLSLPVTGNATATAGKNSQALSLAASAFNSSNNAALNQTFQWQAEPAANDTNVPSATLNLLFGEGTAKPSETGLRIGSNGQIVFATGQTFPGAGGGITGVTAGTDLSGGGSTGNVTLNLNTGATDARYAQLAAANTFSNNQTVNGMITAASSAITIQASSSSGASAAIYGSGGAFGVEGVGSTVGVDGQSFATTGTGVQGFAIDSQGPTYGVVGVVNSVIGTGVSGSSQWIGVRGDQGGKSALGVGYGNAGVWGDTGGPAGTAHTGVLGTADNNYAGYFADASSEVPTLYVENDDTTVGDEVFRAYMADLKTSVIIGDPGCSGNGLYFIALQLGQPGMSGCNNYTLTGGTNGHTYLNASSGSAVHLRVSNLDQVVVTNGNTDILGTLTKPAGSFKIDHPLDPANKYLYHSFVESPDMKNMYDGNVTTDDAGLATITLPDWFETLNRNFRYQLTVIGQFARAIVGSEISGNQFSIRTDKPNVKVSWQVTGTRQDAYANAHRIQVEVEKAPADRGHYLYPELVGAPETARIGYMAPAPGSERVVHHPEARLKRGQALPAPRTPPSVPVPLVPVAHGVVRSSQPPTKGSPGVSRIP
jgi:trimeric autotransporter adhesin